MEVLESHSLRLLTTGDHYPQSGWDFNTQIEHDFNYKRFKSPGFFAFITGSKGAFLYLYTVSHYFMLSLDDVAEIMAQNLTMEEITIPTDSAFIDHGFEHRAWAELHRKYCLRYYVYLILEHVRLEDAI